MSSKSQEDKNQIKLELNQSFEKALTEHQKWWKEESARQLAAATQKRPQGHESTRQENERLKKQLQESQEALYWHKAQLKQQSRKRGGSQGSPMTAGIHAGFPLATQKSPPRATDQTRKRRRDISTEYVSTAVNGDVEADKSSDASLPAPERQRGYANPAATPARNSLSATLPLIRNPAMPTRLPQGLNTNTSPQQPGPQVQTQALHQAQAQSSAQTWAQAQEQTKAKVKTIFEHAQHTGTMRQFHAFMTHANASIQKTGQPQLGIEQLWHMFSQNTAQQANQQPTTPMNGQRSSQFNDSCILALMQDHPQGGGQIALQSSFRPPATLVAQPAYQPFSIQSPSFNAANSFGSAGSMPVNQLCQQSPPFVTQNSMQSLSNMSSDPMLTLTAEYNENSPAVSFTDTSVGQLALQQFQTTDDDLALPTQFPAHSQDGNLYPCPPENLQAYQQANEPTDFGDIPAQASPTLDPPLQDFPVCVRCHEKWWNETCDADEPCQNCVHSGKACERPKCHLHPGTCTSNRCSRVHEGDTRFRHVVARPKTLKREGGKSDAAVSPVELARMQWRADAESDCFE